MEIRIYFFFFCYQLHIISDAVLKRHCFLIPIIIFLSVALILHPVDEMHETFFSIPESKICFFVFCKSVSYQHTDVHFENPDEQRDENIYLEQSNMEMLPMTFKASGLTSINNVMRNIGTGVIYIWFISTGKIN